MNGKTAKLLRKQCIGAKGEVDKKETRVLKKLWKALPVDIRFEKRLKFKTKAS